MKDIIRKSFDFGILQGQNIYVNFQNGFTNTRENIPSMVKTWHEIDRNEPVYAIFYNKIFKKEISLPQIEPIIVPLVSVRRV